MVINMLVQEYCNLQSVSNSYCSNVIVSANINVSTDQYLHSVLPSPGGNIDIDHGNIKVKMD